VLKLQFALIVMLVLLFHEGAGISLSVIAGSAVYFFMIRRWAP
jgi:hypothetical protein